MRMKGLAQFSIADVYKGRSGMYLNPLSFLPGRGIHIIWYCNERVTLYAVAKFAVKVRPVASYLHPLQPQVAK